MLLAPQSSVAAAHQSTIGGARSHGRSALPRARSNSTVAGPSKAHSRPASINPQKRAFLIVDKFTQVLWVRRKTSERYLRSRISLMTRAARHRDSNRLSRPLDAINEQPLHPCDDALGAVAAVVALIVQQRRGHGCHKDVSNVGHIQRHY